MEWVVDKLIPKDSVTVLHGKSGVGKTSLMLQNRAVILGGSSLKVWHISNPTVSPPRLDSDEWEKYKKLPPGLLIFDTLRASQLLDENSPRHMAFILTRLKKLRDMGFTIVLVKDDGINKKRLLRLLKKGEGDYWKLIVDPHSKAKLYDPIIPKAVAPSAI